MPSARSSRRMGVRQIIKLCAASVAVGTIYWGQPVSTWGREMNEALLDRFVQAYKDSAVDPSAVNDVYRRWIDTKLESLGNLPPSLRDEVISGLVADRTRVNAGDPPEARPTELDYDRIWTELWPIDKQSEQFAHQVKQGRKLSDTDRAALAADREQLSRLKTQIGKLPPAVRQHFDQT